MVLINLFLNTMLVSFSVSIIAFIIFVLQRVIKSRISKTWQYYIWLVFIVQLIYPYRYRFSILNGLSNLLRRDSFFLISNEGLVNISVYIGIIWLSVAFILIAKKIIAYQVYIRFVKKHQFVYIECNIFTNVDWHFSACNYFAAKDAWSL
jgi:beta-lactamase regulating signal transducer with metallopeptidase domain